MDLQSSVIHQLEDILASRYVSRRIEILERVTDLFVVGSGKFSDEHVELFDHVMFKLLENVGSAARAQLGGRLAVLPDAPPQVLQSLASDDAIAVAGPVLRQSARIDDATLVQTARSKSQDHLLAISGRSTLTETVTDVLVDRGNAAVVSQTAKNGGARFSETGFSGLVTKASDNVDVALSLWSRPDVPRQALIRLFVDASEAVRNQLTPVDPERADAIRTAVAQASGQLQNKARAGSEDFAAARTEVEGLHATGQLTEARLNGFAKAGSFDKVTLAMALMCDLPLEVVERCFVQDQPDQVLILAKALELSWVTTVALLFMHASASRGPRPHLDQCLASFNRLQPKTAQATLQLYRAREGAAR